MLGGLWSFYLALAPATGWLVELHTVPDYDVKGGCTFIDIASACVGLLSPFKVLYSGPLL